MGFSRDGVERYIRWLGADDAGVLVVDKPEVFWHARVVRRGSYSCCDMSGEVSERVDGMLEGGCGNVIVFNVHHGLKRGVVWHEVGHIMSGPPADPWGWDGLVRSEYSAQAWAMDEALRRGYSRLFGEMVEICRRWVRLRATSLYRGDESYRKAYGRAGQMLLDRYSVGTE